MLSAEMNHETILYDENTLRNLKLFKDEDINKLLKLIIDEVNEEKEEDDDDKNYNFNEKLKVHRL